VKLWALVALRRGWARLNDNIPHEPP